VNARIGPNCVLENDCFVDRGSTLQDSLILPQSYVGESLELSEVVVDREKLVSARAGLGALIMDELILSALPGARFRAWLHRLASQALSCVLLVLFSPVLIFAALLLLVRGPRPLLRRSQIVRLPAADLHSTWRMATLLSFNDAGHVGHDPWTRRRADLRDFAHRFLPGLFTVMRGEASLVGVKPRTKEEILRLPQDWRDLNLRCHVGLVTESTVHPPLDWANDGETCGDAFYSTKVGFRYDARLLLLYFSGVLKSCLNGCKIEPVVMDERAVPREPGGSQEERSQ
jgi:lipopolysaccharide/colanic/teichoic acid biosynthesis glycosyltransferase